MLARYGPMYSKSPNWAPEGCCYHYTTVYALKRILRDGAIKPGPKEHPSQLKRIILFSTIGTWEAGASRPVLPECNLHLDFHAQAAANGGLVRICVEQETSAPLGLKELRRLQGPALCAIQAHTSPGGLYGRLGIWYGSVRPIPRDEWFEISIWRRNRWTPLPFEKWGYPPADVEGAAKVP